MISVSVHVITESISYTERRKWRVIKKDPPQHPNRRAELITSGGGLLFFMIKLRHNLLVKCIITPKTD